MNLVLIPDTKLGVLSSSDLLSLLPTSPLLSSITEYTVDKLELGNLDNLNNLNTEKDIKNIILPIVD